MEIANTPVALGAIAVIAVVAMNYANGSSRRQLLHKERMAALEKGVPLPEDMLVEAEAEPSPRSSSRSTALQGTIWTALGLGMLVASRFARGGELAGELQQFLVFLAMWAIPATFVGVGLLIFAFFTRERTKR